MIWIRYMTPYEWFIPLFITQCDCVFSFLFVHTHIFSSLLFFLWLKKKSSGDHLWQKVCVFAVWTILIYTKIPICVWIIIIICVAYMQTFCAIHNNNSSVHYTYTVTVFIILNVPETKSLKLLFSYNKYLIRNSE